MVLEGVDNGEESDPSAGGVEIGDETPARDGICIVRAHAQRIAEIAERFERDAVGRPAFELIRAVGHQEVPALLVERFERGPTLRASSALTSDFSGSGRYPSRSNLSRRSARRAFMGSERTRSSQSTPPRRASDCENAAQPRSTASSISTRRCQGSVLQGGAMTASCSGSTGGTEV